jgi:NAD(P)-dependent dehydrogenase (short-subunit alcohol dehydrogenase family)
VQAWASRPRSKRGAAIINTTLETTCEGSKLLLDYSSTKGAIVGFTRSLAKNLVKEGVRVNAVAPGPTWTPLNPSGGQPKEKTPEFGKDTPVGRPGQPNEVAPSFLFLACEDSSYMTGQVLHPDGGNTTSS